MVGNCLEVLCKAKTENMYKVNLIINKRQLRR